MTDRETLGKLVRETWVAFAQEQQLQGKEVKPHHLLSWDELDEDNKEVDRRIGEEVALKVILACAEIAEKELNLAIKSNEKNRSPYWNGCIETARDINRDILDLRNIQSEAL